MRTSNVHWSNAIDLQYASCKSRATIVESTFHVNRPFRRQRSMRESRHTHLPWPLDSYIPSSFISVTGVFYTRALSYLSKYVRCICILWALSSLCACLTIEKERWLLKNSCIDQQESGSPTHFWRQTFRAFGARRLDRRAGSRARRRCNEWLYMQLQISSWGL